MAGGLSRGRNALFSASERLGGNQPSSASRCLALGGARRQESSRATPAVDSLHGSDLGANRGEADRGGETRGRGNGGGAACGGRGPVCIEPGSVQGNALAPARWRLLRSGGRYLWLFLVLFALVALPEARAADAPAERSVGELLDLDLLRLRLVIAGLAALVLGGLAWLSSSRRTTAHRKARGAALGLLGVLALAAFAANYNLFMWRRQYGIHVHEVFHYYVGAKYFPELGYFDLYRCSLAVRGQTTPQSIAVVDAVKPKTQVRDLRALRLSTAEEIRAKGPRCDGLFDAERWASFERDVRWFQSRFRPPGWQLLLSDHGFNPSPVWTLIGRPLAEVIPAESLPLRFAVRIDLVLLVVAFAAVGWAFGFTALCTVVIAWGANPLSRYPWVGDAFLRYPWLAAGLLGLCLLKRGHSATGGGLLGLASLLRLFPGFQLVCLALHGFLRGWPRRGRAPEVGRTLAGALAVGLVLIGMAAALNGRGLAAHQEFVENIVPHSEILAWNSVGLRPLLAFSSQQGATPETNTEAAIQQAKSDLLASRWYLYWPALALFGLLLLRALATCEAWEAAALGVVPPLLLTNIASYYVVSFVALALLAHRRPRIGIALMLGLVGWCTSTITFYLDRLDYIASSAIALIVILYALIEMQWPARPRRAASSGVSEVGPPPVAPPDEPPETVGRSRGEW